MLEASRVESSLEVEMPPKFFEVMLVGELKTRLGNTGVVPFDTTK